MMLLLGTTPDELIPADHLIRCVKPFPEQASAVLSPIFGGWYSAAGRPVRPEHLLKTSLLISLLHQYLPGESGR